MRQHRLQKIRLALPEIPGAFAALDAELNGEIVIPREHAAANMLYVLGLLVIVEELGIAAPCVAGKLMAQQTRADRRGFKQIPVDVDIHEVPGIGLAVSGVDADSVKEADLAPGVIHHAQYRGFRIEAGGDSVEYARPVAPAQSRVIRQPDEAQHLAFPFFPHSHSLPKPDKPEPNKVVGAWRAPPHPPFSPPR